jgi:hypothetical protein
MPRATVNLDAGDPVELKTCPGGTVTLRRMSYGAKLERQERSMQMSMELDRRSKGSNTTKTDIALLQTAATAFDFKMCVVDHNLEDASGRKLNLASPSDIASLDPRVGDEISELIDKLNNFEGDLDSEGNS